jgi:PAS domain S-box-containing protein
MADAFQGTAPGNDPEPFFAELFDLYGTLDREGRVITVSGRIFELTSTDPELLAGQKFSETVFWQSSRNTPNTLNGAIARAAGGEKADIVIDFRAGVGKKIPLDISVLPYPGSDGNTIFVCGRELSREGENVTQQSLESEQLLNAAENAEIGLWYWDFAADRIHSTRQCNELLGLPPYETLSLENVLGVIHPGDRFRVNGFLDDSRSRGIKYEEEFRVVSPDGDVEWIAAEGKSLLDSNGRPERMMGILRRVTEQKIAADELSRVYDREKKARDEAVEANRAKDWFIAFVSHELRAQLNPILGWSNILLKREVDDKTRHDALETIQKSANVQAKLINDLVDSVRVASGKIRLEYRPTNLVELVRSSVRANKPDAESRSITLEFSTVEDGVTVFGDANRLQQVFGNIISNAIKFTPEGGRVLVDVGRSGSAAKVTITDTGRGISPRALPNIFRQFSQGDFEEGRSSAGGLGLGLSIAKILAERHGGTIEAKSDGVGQGSQFTVTLPLTDAAEVPITKTPARETPLKPLDGFRIMVVEDDPDSREVLQLFLEQSGAGVNSASNAKAAWDMLVTDGSFKPDLIISDLAMPEEDGYSLMSRIRALPPEAGGRLPSIALSAFTTEESRKKAFDSGFQLYSSKPFDPDQLISQIRQLLVDTGAE